MALPGLVAACLSSFEVPGWLANPPLVML